MSSQTTTSLKLDLEMKERLNRLATSRDRTTHWLMRQAIEQYLEREERRQNLRDEALAAWENYRLTGLHVTADEADAWLAKLEEGEDVEAPPCHG